MPLLVSLDSFEYSNAIYSQYTVALLAMKKRSSYWKLTFGFLDFLNSNCLRCNIIDALTE